jgi:hypothetical protein
MELLFKFGQTFCFKYICHIGQSGAGAGFLRVLRFPLPIFIPPIAPQSPSSVIWGLYNRPEVAAVPSGPSPTPLIIIKKIISATCSMRKAEGNKPLWRPGQRWGDSIEIYMKAEACEDVN